MYLDFEMDFGQGFISVEPPINADGIVLKVIFTDQFPSATIGNTEFEWTGATADKLNSYYQAGLTGGKGIYEGVGLRIYGCGQANTGRIMFFDGYVELSSHMAKFECDKVIAPCKETGKIDWLNDICRAIDFNFLAKLPVGHQGRIIPSTDYKLTPYMVTSIPDYTQAMILAVSEFMMLKELYDTVKTIGQLIDELIGDTSTAVATVGAASGTLIATIAKTVLYVTYLFLIIAAMVNMVKMLIQNVIQTKKYKLTMKYSDMFKRICQYFGLTFSSTILQTGIYKDITWCPAKSVIPSLQNPLNIFDRPQDESQNFPNNTNVHGHYDGNCSDFIATACQQFNAEIKIVGNTLYFEERHHWNNQSQWVIPNTSQPGYTFNLPYPNGTNADELPSNYLLIYSTDASELNTLHRYKGTSLSCTVSPVSVYNIKRVTHNNGVQVRLPMAMARRKEYLSRLENALNAVINGLFGVVNTVINLINGLISAINTAINFFGGNPATLGSIPTLPTNILNNRIGWMEVSNDTFSMPKSFIGIQQGSDWAIHPTSESNVGAQMLFSRFHGKNLATRGNQQLIFRNNTFKFCCDDFQQVLNCNVVFDPTGQKVKITEFSWDIKNETAFDVEYRKYTNFTNNLKETILIDGN